MAAKYIDALGSPPLARMRPSSASTSACRSSASPSRISAPYARGESEAPVCCSAQSSSSAPFSKSPTTLRPMMSAFSASSAGAIVSQREASARTGGERSARRSSLSIIA
eukprot:scaffold151194_cov34-Tisochrysis_lutea.AAC.2